jgi:tRNA (guanosine-2'-O-)-methyltransferase
VNPLSSASQAAAQPRRPIALALAALAIATLGACIEVPPPKTAAPLAPKNIKAPDGESLDAACTPTGVEICFDARDNNCNGVIDEGCGVHTGILQFSIAWDAAEADVDLQVFDTQGEQARMSESTPDGLMKDRECPNDGACYGQNIENVFLAEGEPKRGKYRVVVHLNELNGATAPVKVQLGVRVGQKTYAAAVQVAPGPTTQDREFEFTL